jgi:hypothetical protein
MSSYRFSLEQSLSSEEKDSQSAASGCVLLTASNSLLPSDDGDSWCFVAVISSGIS